MALSNHIDALVSKHAFMDHIIREEMRSACPDFLEIAACKKNKLALKQEIERLSLNENVAGSA